MELFASIIDIFIHLDKHLGEIISHYGTWTYAIIFIVIFCETGLVVTPFLPGDSFLFAIGAFCSLAALDLALSLTIVGVAAVLGDSVNYAIGKKIGLKAFSANIKFLKKEYLIKTQQFYERHGGKTIIIARFVPIIRTFAPFVAGIGTMRYARFLSFNIIGGLAWTALFIITGYLFGNIPFIKQNFSLVIFVIILISLLPGIIEYFRHRKDTVS